MRLIREEEIVRGVIGRLTGMGIYSAVTITMIRDGEVYLSRPFVYAHEHFDSRNGLMGCENFSMSIRRATQCIEVETDRDDKPTMMVT
jgi:hypothetical protein